MSAAPRSVRRRFLFLQGLPGFFFSRLGAALLSRGHDVRRVNFNLGDRLFWRLPGAEDYRGGPKGWPAWLERRLDRWRPTDIVLFGDCRPLHRAAVALAEARGIDVHVAEEGYLRPNWVTLEPGGVNGHSFLSRDPDWYLAAAREAPPWTGGVPVLQSFGDRAREDVLYNVAALLGAPAYPGYRTHRTQHPVREYMDWIRKLARRRTTEAHARERFEALRAGGAPYHLFPLQLDGDYQLREHSPFRGVEPALAVVLDSFARAAPPGARLLVKDHPLNSGMIDWGARVRRAAAQRGIGERVEFVDGGLLEPMLEHATGVVTVNSTVGFLALAFGRPTMAVGDAIYGIPRLTFQGALDDFWTKGSAPDAEVFDAFRRVVAQRTQLNGGFFSERGVTLAVAAAVERLEGPVRLPSAVRVRTAAARSRRRASDTSHAGAAPA